MIARPGNFQRGKSKRPAGAEDFFGFEAPQVNHQSPLKPKGFFWVRDRSTAQATPPSPDRLRRAPERPRSPKCRPAVPFWVGGPVQ